MSATLWCVHVYGPDDLLACASRKDAIQNALWLNLSGYQQQNTNDELMPVAWAVPEPWPYDAGMHAAELVRQNREDRRWTADETKLHLLAGELYDFTEDGKPIDWHATVAAERRDGAINALGRISDDLLSYRDALRTWRGSHTRWALGVEEAAGEVRAFAAKVASGEVTL